MAMQHREPRPRPKFHIERYEPCPARCQRGVIRLADAPRIIGHTDDGTTIRTAHPVMAVYATCPTCGGAGRVRRAS